MSLSLLLPLFLRGGDGDDDPRHEQRRVGTLAGPAPCMRGRYVATFNVNGSEVDDSDPRSDSHCSKTKKRYICALFSLKYIFHFLFIRLTEHTFQNIFFPAFLLIYLIEHALQKKNYFFLI